MKCLDTYALVEIHNGNPKFAHFINQDCVITDITFAEFYAGLYRNYNLHTAEYWHKKLSFLCRPVSRDILLKAVRFRIDNKKQNISFFDCVGYIFAIENNMIFVTGDKEFAHKPAVEFVKKD